MTLRWKKNVRINVLPCKRPWDDSNTECSYDYYAAILFIDLIIVFYNFIIALFDVLVIIVLVVVDVVVVLHDMQFSIRLSSMLFSSYKNSITLTKICKDQEKVENSRTTSNVRNFSLKV